MAWAELLYASHTALEIVLGGIKLRGRYAHETPGSKAPRSQMYTRHHGFSLLALALLGGLVLWRDLVNTELGFITSVVQAVFHGGACVAFTYAYLENAIPFVKIIVPHAPFAAAFVVHAFSIA